MASVKPDAPDEPRRGRRRSESSRLAILEATRDLLAELGYDRLSIQQIAEAAGVGKQTVYRWWPSKAAVVAECVLEGYVLPQGVELADTGDVRRDVRALFRALAEHYGRPPHASLMRALTAASAESEEVAAKLFERLADPFRAMLLERLTAAQCSGQVQPGAPLVPLAEALIGALLFRVLTRERVDPEQMARLADAVLGGVAEAGPRRRSR